MKKLLALVLALVMTLSLCVTSNAAFADAADIEHDEAVEVMSALGVINGKGDNKFDPKGNVTRAEMAKMITIVMLGDVDAAAFVGTTTDLKDINGHWAEGYIKYCYSQGVIAGKGNGIFAPNDKVTALEAAKMLLVAIGYNATVQGYVGGEWAINVVRDAQLSGFYDKLTGLTSGKVLSRDEAAQMIYNAIGALLIEKSPALNVTTGTLTYSYKQNDNNKTLLSETFGAKKEYGFITNVDWDSTKEQYAYTMGVNNFGVDIHTDDDHLVTLSFTSKVDYSSLFGQKVAVVYKNAKTVYGMYSDAAVLATGVAGDIEDVDGNAPGTEDKVVLGGTTVKLATASNTNKVWKFNTDTVDAIDDIAAGNVAVSNVYNTVVAIDNNDDGKADAFVSYPADVQKVSYVGATSVTSTAGTTSYSYAYDKDEAYYTKATVNYTFYEGVAKNDYVLVPAYGVDGATRAITKVDMVEGKITAAKAASVELDGKWYNKNGNTIALGDTYKLWVVNDYVVGTKVVTTASKDLALVIAEDPATELKGITAKLMFADGTIEVVEISKVNGTAVAKNNTLNGKGIAALTLVTYEKKSDGTYEVKDLSATNKAGYDTVYSGSKDNDYTVANSSTNTPAKVAGYPIADDGLFFVVYNTGATNKYTVVSGATLKTYTAIANGTDGDLLTNAVNGIETAAVGVIQTAATNFGTTDVYAYVTSTPFETLEGTTHYWNYNVWTKDGALTVKDTENNGLAKGSVISYVNNTDGTVTSTDIAEDEVAIIGYDAEDKVLTAVKTDGTYAGAGVATSIQNKTVVLYVNTKDHVGIEGGEIALAQETNVGGYVSNAKLYYSGDLKLIVVDTNNNYGNDTTDTFGYVVTIPAALAGDTLAGATVTWTVDGIAVTAGSTAYAVKGQAVVATVKMSDTAVSLTTGATLTANTVDAVVPAAKVATAPKFYNGTAPVALNGTTEACAATAGTVTFTTATADKVASGEFTFTWIVDNENIAPTVTYDAAP